MPIRVVIADDHPIVREGLRVSFAAHSDIEIVGEAENGLEAIRVAEACEPDVVIMDITMPKMDGITATRRIRQENAQIRVLGLTIHENEEYLLEFIRAGGSGYVLKRAGIRELVAAIRAVNRGEAFLYPSAATAVIVDYIQRHEDGKANPDQLTVREWEVLRLIAEGHSNQEIATILHRSVKTVQTHRTHLMKKLGLHDRADIVRYAIRKGLIQP